MNNKNLQFSSFFLLMIALLVSAGTHAQTVSAIGYQKISDTQGGFTGVLDNNDEFGRARNIGDIDNNGYDDFAVGARYDDDGGGNKGAVWILFMDSTATVMAHQKISDTQGNFTASMNNDFRFGGGVEGLGDLDGDGVEDIVVGAPGNDEGGNLTGSLFILFLDTNGTVKTHQKIGVNTPNFTGYLGQDDHFGYRIANMGDMDGDSVIDIAVSSQGDDDGGGERGACYIIFLNSNGTVKNAQKISDTQGNFTGILDNVDRFGFPTNIGDLDGDGVNDIAMGAMLDDDGGTDRGAVYICFMNANGTVDSHQKISSTQGGFGGTLDDGDRFGPNGTMLGDLTGDGRPDYAFGAFGDDDGGTDRGAVWILSLNTNGTVAAEFKISNTQGGLTAPLADDDFFGGYLDNAGDLDGNGYDDLIVGAMGDNDGGTDRGACYIVYLEGCSIQAGFTSSANLLTVSFTDTSAGSVSWYWDFGDGNLSVNQNPNHTYSNPGWYYVCLTATDSTGCESTVCDSIYVSSVGMASHLQTEFSAYPNPTTGRLMITLGTVVQAVEIEISNVNGQVVLSRNFGSTDRVEVQVPGAPGLYFVEVRSEAGKKAFFKVLKR